MSYERLKKSRKRRAKPQESPELYTFEPQSEDELYTGEENDGSVNAISFTDKSATKAQQKRDKTSANSVSPSAETASQSAKNAFQGEKTEPEEDFPRLENGEPSLLPPFSPHAPLFSPVTLPLRNRIIDTAAAAAADENDKNNEWEELLKSEICPPGKMITREIRGFIERGIREELVCEIIREAALSGAQSAKYVVSILERCEAEGIKTVQSFHIDAQKKKKSTPGYGRSARSQRGFNSVSSSKMTQSERDTLVRLGFDFGDTANKMSPEELETLRRYRDRIKEEL